MTRRALVPLAALAAVAVPAAAHAAGPPAARFVPPGFQVEKRVRAQIGGDARPDLVLVLVRRAPAAAPGAEEPALPRRLVVLKARSDGGYVLVGDGRRVLLCTRCGGAFFGSARTPVTVRVRRGIVIAEQTSGSRELVFQRFRFRTEGALSTRLIGVDTTRTDRLTGEEIAISTNLLTGDRVVVRTAPGEARRETRSRVPARTVPIEDVVAARYR